MKVDTSIHGTELQNEIEKQPLIIQEHVIIQEYI